MEQYRDCLGPWSSVLPLKTFPKTVPLGGGSQWCLASPLQQEPQTCLIRGCRGGFCGFLGTDMLKHYFSGDTQLRRAFLTFSHSPKNTSLNTRQPFNHHFYLGCCSSMKVEAGLSGTDLRHWPQMLSPNSAQSCDQVGAVLRRMLCPLQHLPPAPMFAAGRLIPSSLMGGRNLSKVATDPANLGS